MKMCSSCGINKAYENSDACHACYDRETHDKQGPSGDVLCCRCGVKATGRYPFNESPRCRQHMPAGV